MCSVQCAADRVQCEVCSVPCAACSVQLAGCTCSVQHAVCSVRCAACSVHCAACTVQRAVFSVRYWRAESSRDARTHAQVWARGVWANFEGMVGKISKASCLECKQVCNSLGRHTSEPEAVSKRQPRRHTTPTRPEIRRSRSHPLAGRFCKRATWMLRFSVLAVRVSSCGEPSQHELSRGTTAPVNPVFLGGSEKEPLGSPNFWGAWQIGCDSSYSRQRQQLW